MSYSNHDVSNSKSHNILFSGPYLQKNVIQMLHCGRGAAGSKLGLLPKYVMFILICRYQCRSQKHRPTREDFGPCRYRTDNGVRFHGDWGTVYWRVERWVGVCWVLPTLEGVQRSTSSQSEEGQVYDWKRYTSRGNYISHLVVIIIIMKGIYFGWNP